MWPGIIKWNLTTYINLGKLSVALNQVRLLMVVSLIFLVPFPCAQKSRVFCSISGMWLEVNHVVFYFSEKQSNRYLNVLQICWAFVATLSTCLEGSPQKNVCSWCSLKSTTCSTNRCILSSCGCLTPCNQGKNVLFLNLLTSYVAIFLYIITISLWSQKEIVYFITDIMYETF
jgi:hypothetical protein